MPHNGVAAVSAGGGGGDGISQILFYSEKGFKGQEQVFMESQSSVKKALESVGSIIVKGNPWLIYPEDGMKGDAVMAESGSYPDVTENLGPWCDSPASIKFIADDFNAPEIVLVSSTDFDAAESTEWRRADLNVQLIKCVSVGKGGIWAIKSKDDSVWCRMHSESGAGKPPPGKVAPDTTPGDSWTKIQGGLRQLSVGENSVWGVNADGRVLVRIGIGEESITGREWATVDGETMKHVSVSNLGHVWACDHRDKIWYRKGANNKTVLGSTWKSISGNLKQISVGFCGVWGINAEGSVYYRLNTYGDPESEGTGWQKIEGKFQQIYSGGESVLALAANRDIYYRASVFDRGDGSWVHTANHEGTHWVRIEQGKDNKIIFKQVECALNSMWAVDKDNTVWYKDKANPDITTYPHFTFYTYGDQANFERYKFPAKAATYKVTGGGWALYSEPDFKGKVMYHFGNETLSNDPPSKENVHKSVFTQIGSVRPMRGQNYKTPMIRINPLWDQVVTEVEEIELFSREIKNEEEGPGLAPWKRTFFVESAVEHEFELKQAQNIAGSDLDVIRGCKFEVAPIEPLKFEVENGPEENTGADFHRQLESEFCFFDELKSCRSATEKRIIRLPPRIPPRCTFTVRVVQCKVKFTAPFKADFKMGFDANYHLGSDEWHDGGTYRGMDSTNIKVETNTVKMPPARKVSKMLNGLGDDM